MFDVDPSGFEGVNADTLQAILDAENERVRIQWIRALAYAVGQYRKLAKDKDIDELSEQALGGLTNLSSRRGRTLAATGAVLACTCRVSSLGRPE